MQGTYNAELSRGHQANLLLLVVGFTGYVPDLDELIRTTSCDASWYMGIHVKR